MRARLAFALAFIALPAFAQGLTGSWSGTYTFSIQLASCQNKTFTWSGNASLMLLQSGKAVSGRIDLTNYTLFSSSCNTSIGEVTHDLIGVISGSTLGLTVPNDSNGWQVTGDVEGDTITAQLSDFNGLTGSFNLERVAADPPASDATGAWSGTYRFTDVCPSGSGTKAYNGAFTLGLTQSGSQASGVATMTGVPIYDQSCATFATLTMALSVSGTVSGSTFAGAAFDPAGSFDFPISATIADGSIGGSASGASPTATSGTFTLTRSDAQIPASDFAGRYDGTYDESDDESTFCLNVGIIHFGGAAAVTVTQAGAAVSGALSLENAYSVVSDGFGDCQVVNLGEVVYPLYGTLAGNRLTTTLAFGGEGVQLFTIDFSGDSLSGTMADSFGDASVFNASRASRLRKRAVH